MKILYVGHTYTVRANQAKIAALGRAMPDSQITLVTPHAWRGPLYENSAEPFDTRLSTNVDHRILKAFFIGREGAYFFGASIVGLIARLKPDIVHVEQGAYATVYAQILFLLRLVSPKSKAIFFTWWNLPYRPNGIKRLNENYNLKHSAAAIAGNEAAKAILIEHGFQRPIHVLPQLGIDLHPIPERPKRTSDRFVIGYAGRIAEEKGVLDLVDTMSKMELKDRVTLYFVGSGDALPEVERRATSYNLNFEHHPSVMNDALPAHLAKMDILVLPSRTTQEWVEQFGHILLEAMAMGIPVIGSSSGEIPNVIGDAGIIFPEGDCEALAKQLDRLASEPEVRLRLSTAGLARIQTHFTHDIIARKQAEIYDWMIREGESVRGRPADR